MKQFLLLFLTFAFFSCSEDDSKESVLPKLEITELKGFLPFELLTANNSIFFKDLDGNEKKLIIIRESSTRSSMIDGFEYEAEYYSFMITEQFSFDYFLQIEISGHYIDPMTADQSVDCILAAASGEVPFISIDENGEVEFEQREDRTFGNKFFSDVISSSDLSNQLNGFSQFHYNFEFGIVAFIDGSDKIWIFDRFD